MEVKLRKEHTPVCDSGGGVEGLTGGGDVPEMAMARSVKLAQQLLNRMVAFPSRPPTGAPLPSFRTAVTRSVVTPTDTQLPWQRGNTVR